MISTEITDHLVSHTAAGASGFEEVTTSMEAWYTHPDFDPDRPILWDFRSAELALPDVDIAEWSERNRRAINEIRKGRKTAWVFGNSRAAEIAVDILGAFDWQHRVRIFNDDIEAAQAWLTSTIR